VLPLDYDRLTRLKPTFATRRVVYSDFISLDDKARALEPGDIVLARIESVGHHDRIERPDGRKAKLKSGDEVVLACGARYAPDRLEATVPEAVGPASMVAASGIAGTVQTWNARLGPATGITILGALHGPDGSRLNLRRYAIDRLPQAGTAPVLAVCGTSMDVGKAHTVASLVHGFARSGRRVAAIKVTGTSTGGDLWSYQDSGAQFVADFTDTGLASTDKIPLDDILDVAGWLIAAARSSGAEAIVMDVADGLYQAETAALMKSGIFKRLVDGVHFAAADATDAQAGVAWLQREGYRVQGISGVLTKSPRAMRETEEAVGLPCYTPGDLLKTHPMKWLLQLAQPLRLTTFA